MKIISGKWRGKILNSPQGVHVRPTAVRSREALFGMLETHINLTDKIIADLFCGSGALGLEALSRGGRHALMVDLDLKTAQKNTQALQTEKLITLVKQDACTLSAKHLKEVDIVFMDPPYGKNLAFEALEAINPHLKSGAFIAIEVEKAFPYASLPYVNPNAPLEYLAHKTHGAATLILLQKP